MKRTLTWAILMLVLASLACQAVAGTEEPPPAAPTESAQDNPMPPAPTDPAAAPPPADGVAGTLMFEDDFSDATSGWDIAEWENGVTRYTDDGQYEIVVKAPQYDIWANPGLYFTDTRTEVDFIKVSGTDSNDIGIMCRYNETETDFEFYYLVVGSDGYAGIYKYFGSEFAPLIEAEVGTVSVAPEGQVNHIRADCIGDRLTLFVNGEMVLQAQDADLTAGDVGLVAGVFDDPYLQVYFDNFKVYVP